MAKINFDLSVSFTVGVGVLLCCLVLTAASSEESNESNPKPNPAEGSELSLILQRLAQIVEHRNQEHEKVVEEMKILREQFKSFQSSQETCEAQVQSLSEKLNEFESKFSSDRGLWLLTPPLRGPPGKKGEPGANGIQGPKGDSGVIPTTKEPPVKIEEQTSVRPTEELPKVVAPESSITSCSDAMNILSSPRSKKQSIRPHGNTTSLEVLCDFENDGGGWTLIQKRSSGPREQFDRNWTEYANGFGSLDGNFWMGLENIRVLTKNGDQELRIELEDFEGNKAYAKYSNFSISDASDFYRLSIGDFSGNARDSMNWHNEMKFTTKDQDNDNWSGNCAVNYPGGWWFRGCFHANLNGLYRNKGDHTASDFKGIMWYHWKNTFSYSLAKTEMKIRKSK